MQEMYELQSTPETSKARKLQNSLKFYGVGQRLRRSNVGYVCGGYSAELLTEVLRLFSGDTSILLILSVTLVSQGGFHVYDEEGKGCKLHCVV